MNTVQLIQPDLAIESILEEELFDTIAGGLERDGYVVLPAALPHAVGKALLDHLASLNEQKFHRARVGRGRNRSKNQLVRKDQIHWIRDGEAHGASWLQWTNRLRNYLNRRLFLGLFSFESHFSLYEPGDFYRRHLDAFKGEANRVLSLVCYLNRGWEADQGGQLLIYNPADGSELTRVLPAFGTLVLFLSEEFPHEVLPTDRERHAVAGWFRLNTSVGDQLDPPR